MGLLGKKKNVQTDDMGIDDDMGMGDDLMGDPTPTPRKKKSGGAGGILGLLLALVLVAGIGFCVYGIVVGPTRGQCKEIVSTFQSGCNELNATELISVLKPSISNALNASLIITGLVTDSNPNDWIPDILSSFSGNLGSLTQGTNLEISDVFKQINLKVERIGLPGKVRRVRCKASFGGISQRIYIYVSKSQGEPYISSIKLAND